MCKWLLDNKADEYEFIFTFANTGLEHENSLDFLNECDQRFGLNLVWLEAVVNPEHGKGIRHKVVDYETASRNGEPFEAFIRKSGIPNQSYNQCSERLKAFPMESYRRSLGFKAKHQTAIGIRADEIDRVSENATANGLIYPLIMWTQATKAEVRHWWAAQDFDLDLPEHMGNCISCWRKSDRKLMTIAKHEPERFDFMARMERDYGDVGSAEKPRTFFRGNRSAQDIIAAAQLPFSEFVDHMPELQLRLIDPMDIEGDCGSGCEVQ